MKDDILLLRKVFPSIENPFPVIKSVIDIAKIFNNLYPDELRLNSLSCLTEFFTGKILSKAE